MSFSNIDPDALYCAFSVKGSYHTLGTLAFSCTIYTTGPLLPNVRDMASSNRGTHFIIIFSLYLLLTRGYFG